jgi:hypothetical protein
MRLPVCLSSAVLLFVSCQTATAYASDRFKVQVVETSGMITTTAHGISTATYAKVILPSGDHADLYCGDLDKHCAKIDPIAPEKMRPDATTCFTQGDQTLCTTRDVGDFWASRKGNMLTIEAPNGKLTFKITGSW